MQSEAEKFIKNALRYDMRRDLLFRYCLFKGWMNSIAWVYAHGKEGAD